MQNSCLAMMLNVVLWGRSESDLIFSSGMSVHYVWLLFWLQVARYFSSLMLFWPILSANVVRLMCSCTHNSPVLIDVNNCYREIPFNTGKP